MLSPINNKTLWNKALSSFKKNKNYDFYHEYDYCNLYSDINSKIEFFYFENGKDKFFFPYLKRKINKSNFYDFETPYGYGGPLSNSHSKKFINLALNEFKKKSEKNNIVAGIIRFNPFFSFLEIIESPEVKILYKTKIVIMKCEKSYEEIKNEFPKDVIVRLKKSENQKIYYETSNSKKRLKNFESIYLERMKNLEADQEYYFSNDFFEKFSFLNESNWKVFSVFKEDKFIGGALVLFTKNNCNIHLSSSLKEYFKYSPNIVIRNAIIKFCHSNNIKIINFGGGRTNKPEDSLLNFKKKFSNETENYYLGGIIVNEQKYKELIEKWDSHPKRNNKFKNYFLKYRY